MRARKILIKEGVPGLLVGLGFVLVLWGGLAYGGLNPPPAGFCSMTIIGSIMILSSVLLAYKALKMKGL